MAYLLSIQQFIDHFRTARNQIEQVSLPLHRKVLYAAALDPLSRAVYGPRPKGARHRDWIVRLLVELAGWQEAEHISLPQLKLLLRENGRTRCRLYRQVLSRLRGWPQGSFLPAKPSPNVAELLPFAAPIEQPMLERAQYVQLFYTYRNNLIHEFREPGEGTDWGRPRREPFYTFSGISHEWELLFPVGFFAELFARSLQGVEARLRHERKGPHSNFEFGSLWRAG